VYLEAVEKKKKGGSSGLDGTQIKGLNVEIASVF
jgi:hypothetical protein